MGQWTFTSPKAPDGNESNWIPTSTDGGFEVLFRFYGPEKPLFDKTWRLPDIEVMTERNRVLRDVCAGA